MRKMGRDKSKIELITKRRTELDFTVFVSYESKAVDACIISSSLYVDQSFTLGELESITSTLDITMGLSTGRHTVVNIVDFKSYNSTVKGGYCYFSEF